MVNLNGIFISSLKIPSNRKREKNEIKPKLTQGKSEIPIFEKESKNIDGIDIILIL